MSVTIDLPEEIAQQLQAHWGDLSRRTLEALAIEGYRSMVLSLGQVAEMLGLSVWEAEVFLKERGVDMLYTVEDLKQDIATNEHLLSK
ncbi:MAG: UPF0175 family protein [Blastocatellia bacterium]